MTQPSQLDVYLPWNLLSAAERQLFALEFSDLEPWELEHSLYWRDVEQDWTHVLLSEVQ